MNRLSTPPSLHGFRAIGFWSLLLLTGCGGGPAPPDDTGSALAAPVLAVSAAHIKTLRLDWTAVAGATEYRVSVSPDALQPFELDITHHKRLAGHR